MKNKVNYLVTGGTGSFGKHFIKKILLSEQTANVTVFSRDELKQFEMQDSYSDNRLKFMLGDVRDEKRILEAVDGIDVIIHAAAMKQIPACENNPSEAINTNIGGAENIIAAALKSNVQKVIALSTDKAANPANLYGATKLASDKLMIAANSLVKSRKCKFSVVRYGNVLGSRGSVIPFFKQKAVEEKSIPITDERMTRFWITLDQGVQFVIDSLEIMIGGEIFVPKIPSFSVIDVAKVVTPNIPIRIIGIRPGEKLHEVMITEDDSINTYEFDNYYVIIPPQFALSAVFREEIKVKNGFKFSSDKNPNWFTPSNFEKILIEAGVIS